jgi:transcriptional regulator with XRE-family HTH domain
LAQERGKRLARQLLTTVCLSPKAAANLPTPPSASIAICKMSMTVFKHVSDNLSTTKVIKFSTLITDVKTLANRIKESRERLKLTQAGLAKASGVSQGTIGNLESGIRKSAREILSIAAALGVSPQWLATGKTTYGPQILTHHAVQEPDPGYVTNPLAIEALAIFCKLPNQSQQAAIVYLKFLAAQAKNIPPSIDAKRAAISQAQPKTA